MGKLRLGILGSGFHSEIIVKAYLDGLLDDYELVGIMGRNPETLPVLAESGKCRACTSIEELLELKPDYIAEAASIQLIKDSAEKILNAKCSLVMISIGAFADAEFYDKIRMCAAANGVRVYLASGCVGGFDVLRTISLMGCTRAGIETHKGPKSLRNTPLFQETLMEGTEETHVFEGNAKEAIELLPTKVNVAVAASLATRGPKNTSVDIYSVPEYIGDDHKITAEADGVKAVVDIYSSTSALAAWSEVAVLRNIVSPIVF
ncbi:MAG: aspartate dehydrogenase domain-containing protein [Brotaphodocola sp.]